MKKYLPILLLITLGITTRLIPHLPNFTAVAAIGLFGGLYLPRRYAIASVIVLMFLSDAIIGFYNVGTMIAVYFSLAIAVYIGHALKAKNRAWSIAGAVLASFTFFVITNAAVWVWSGMYAHTISGLWHSYYNALPFWRNMLAGDLFYTTVLVGGYELACRLNEEYNKTRSLVIQK